MSKRRGILSKGAVGGPCRGSPGPGGVGDPMADLRACGARLWLSPNTRAPQLGGSGLGYASSFPSRILWFSRLFLKYRSQTDVILEPLCSYLRYGRNGSCFVGFRGRL